jgi:glycosyltransferase involved in cell wall biosynthesis
VSNAKPTVAICIPTYNQGKFIGEAIRSAMEQDYRPIEIWISDDASTDDTAEVVKQFLGGATPVFYFRQPENLGMARNNNWVMSRPKAEFIVQLDSDDVLEAACVSRLMELMEEYPRAGYAHSAVDEIDELGNSNRVRRLHRAATFEDAESSLRKSVMGYRVAANMCMYRAQALREVNYCREMNFALDWDLAVRIADAGWGNVYSPLLLGKYRVWSDQSNSRVKRKKTELLGIESVFRDSLMKAFERRGWPCEPLFGSMRGFAMAHAECLAWDCFSEDEKRELQSILLRLGGSSGSVRLRCWMMQHGLAPMFQMQRDLTVFAKDKAKAVLSVFRRA